MKTILLSLLIAFCALPVCAQVSIGVIGGYSHATTRVQDKPAPFPLSSVYIPSAPESKYISKWHAGLIADIHLTKRFYLQPQLLVSTKGMKLEQGGQKPTIAYQLTNKANLVYLELPVNLLYKIPFGRGKIAVGAGVYVGKPLSGKFKDNSALRTENDLGTTVVSASQQQGDILFDNKIPSPPKGYSYYKKHDEGLNFIAGYEFKNGLLFNINYSLGLTDVYTYDPETRKNSYFGISAGYLLKLRRR